VVRGAAVVLGLAVFGGSVQAAVPVARVGSWTVDARDLELRRRVVELYYPASATGAAALVQLVRGFVAAEVLRMRGAPVTEKVLEAEARRIDRRTQNPQLLARVKRVFGTDRPRYLRVFVLPAYAPSRLWRNFIADARVHAAARARAEELVRRVREKKEPWDEALKALGLEARKVRISRRDGVRPKSRREARAADRAPRPIDLSRARNIPANLRERFAGTAEKGDDPWAVRYLDRVVSKIAPGEVYPNVLELEGGFQVVRLAEKKGDDHAECDLVTVPKRDFDGYVAEMASGLAVEVGDADLGKAVFSKVSWLRARRDGRHEP